MGKFDLKRKLIAEFLGSAFLLLIVNGVVIMFDGTMDTTFMSAIAVPAILFVVIEIFGPISGAHFNPFVTMIHYFEKEISAKDSFLYTTAQILGGLLGIIISHLMFLHHSGGLIFLSEIVRPDLEYFSEFVVTFMLILAILILTRVKSKNASFVIPLLVGANIISTSSTMFANPQVTFARIFTNSAAGIRPFDGFVFIVMQFIGALVAYLVYKYFFVKK